MRNNGICQSLCILVNEGMLSGFRAWRKPPRSEGWGWERGEGNKGYGKREAGTQKKTDLAL